jgi:magnesium chelatase family protein
MQIVKYQKKISGPLLDRIDLHIEVPRVEFDKLSGEANAESSDEIRARVMAARERQAKRFSKSNCVTNSEMKNKEIKEFCALGETSISLLRQAVSHLHLSARSYHRILKLARTIADLAASDNIETHHIAEALQYRPKID